MPRRGFRKRSPLAALTLATVSVVTASLLTGLAAPAGAAAHTASPPGTGSSSTGSSDHHSSGIVLPKQPVVGQAIKPNSTYRPAGCNTPVPKNVARCWALIATRHGVTPNAAPAGPLPGALGPAEIQNAYHLPATGATQTVAVVDAYGYSTAESDLAVYRSQYKLPACTTANGCFTKVNQRGVKGSYPKDDGDWSIETALDLDAVSAACPACHILLVEGDTPNLPDLAAGVDTAVHLGAKYVSNSYGVPGETAEQKDYDSHYTHPGVAVTVSSGDTGNVQEWPSTNPNVIAVGGTTLNHASNTRGWNETAWNSGGSGCSLYEDKPAYQDDVDTDCAKRAVADVSAVADPATGLSVYNTLGDKGWDQYGGTSLSSPLVAAMYALAGPQPAGSNPVESLYANQGLGLSDVTSGTNGTCGTVLCTARAGWDGPTGWGTPYDITGLTTVPHGVLSGTVTSSGKPVPSVTITFSNGSHTFTAITDAQGKYSLNLPAGSYSYVTNVYSYEPAKGSGITIKVGADSVKNISIVKAPQTVLSGTVKDGSGHGWPLYAKITVDGYPGGPIFTNPFTGAYSVTLPGDHSYAVHTEPIPTGYAPVDQNVTLTNVDAQLNASPKITPELDVCDVAPGYGYAGCEDFDGWTAPQDGWTVTQSDSSPTSWTFTDVARGFYTGEGIAAADIPTLNDNKPTDAYLTSPAYDLSKVGAPHLGFNYAQAGGTLSVDLSLDNGASWKTILSQQKDEAIGQAVDVALPGAGGHTGVRVRVHYAGSGEILFVMDNLTVGSLAELPGGLVAGLTRDANTAATLNTVKVTDQADPAVTTTSRATPEDKNLGDGYYSLFEPHTGRRNLTESALRYASVTRAVTVQPDALTRFDPALQAGRLSVAKTTIDVTQTLGASTTTPVTVTNTGKAPLHVSTSEQEAGFTPLLHPAGAAGSAAMSATATAAANGWQALPDLPQPALDNAVGSYRGNVYSFGGAEGLFSPTIYDHNYVYKPSTHAWSWIADAPAQLVSAQGTFLGDTFYLVGGAKADPDLGQVSVRDVYAYHPDSNTWTTVAPLPNGLARSAVTTLDNQLYVVGGCHTDCGDLSNEAYRYDPASNKWTSLPKYPLTTSFVSCGGLALRTPEVVCAGGITEDADGHVVPQAATYAYRPGSNSWVKLASMPTTGWGMSAANSGGQLQVANGTTDGLGFTSDNPRYVYQYDPVHNAWASLPNSLDLHFRGGGGCGFYNIGGENDPADFFPFGVSAAEILPGFDQCETDDVNWLSESNSTVTIAPGASATINVTVDSSTLSAPGTYHAQVDLITDSPYTAAPINVNLVANPPKRWGLLAGTVTDASTHKPLTDATVSVCTMYDTDTGSCGAQSYTLHTDAQGNYRLWLDAAYAPLHLIVTAPGHEPAFRVTGLTAGQESDVAFALTPSASPAAKRAVRTPSVDDQAAGLKPQH